MSLDRNYMITAGRVNLTRTALYHDFHRHDAERLFDDIIGGIQIMEEPIQLAWAGAEHIDIGDLGSRQATLSDIIGDAPFRLGKTPVQLSYGQIVALGGDFYARFDAADDTYTGSRNNNSFFGQPLSTASDIQESLKTARRNRVEEKKYYEKLKQRLEVLVRSNMTYISGPSEEEQKEAKDWLHHQSSADQRSAVLALENWDHFHPHCIDRYKRLQRRAIELAKKAGAKEAFKDNKRRLGRSDLSEKFRTVLHDALALNAFANHFLTDAFSAGHLFKERKVQYDHRYEIDEITDDISPVDYIDPDIDPTATLIEIHNSKIDVGELLVSVRAQNEHDTRCDNGVLAVCEAHRDTRGKLIPFKVLGDWNLRLPADNDYRNSDWAMKALVYAVTASIQEIIDAFLGDTTPLGSKYKRQKLKSPVDYIPHALASGCKYAPTP